MIAAAHNKVDLVEMLLDLGARPGVRACNNFTALDWAMQKGYQGVVDVLQSYM
jgi:ankyrin repeat protein